MIITLCGSCKFKSEMMKLAEKLTLEGNCVLTRLDLIRSCQDSYTAGVPEFEHLNKTRAAKCGFQVRKILFSRSKKVKSINKNFEYSFHCLYRSEKAPVAPEYSA